MPKTSPISWSTLYQLWQYSAQSGSAILKEPIALEELTVSYSGPGFFYGYDWLPRADFIHRKELLQTNPAAFFCFTPPTNKGTIHTLQMLTEAKDEEEQATIWLCAFAKELSETLSGPGHRNANWVWNVCHDFLNTRYYLWHHAMKRLVPQIFISSGLCEDLTNASFETIVDLAQLNAALTLHEYVPILYSSLPAGQRLQESSLHR